MKGDGWRVPGCDLSLLKTINLLHLGLNDCSNVTDERILKGLTGCNESVCEDISGYIMIRDAGVSALGAKCGQLQSINLECCSKVTDAGVSALGAECGQLQSINLECCGKVTDAGVSALVAGCCQLVLDVVSCRVMLW